VFKLNKLYDLLIDTVRGTAGSRFPGYPYLFISLTLKQIKVFFTLAT